MKTGVRCCHNSRVLLGSYMLFHQELLLFCPAKHKPFAQQRNKAYQKCVGYLCNCKDYGHWS